MGGFAVAVGPCLFDCRQSPQIGNERAVQNVILGNGSDGMEGQKRFVHPVLEGEGFIRQREEITLLLLVHDGARVWMRWPNVVAFEIREILTQIVENILQK